jgi:hypothetical protein
VGIFVCSSGAAIASTEVETSGRFVNQAAVVEPGSFGARIQSFSTAASFAQRGLPHGLSYRSSVTWVVPDYRAVMLLDQEQKALPPPDSREELRGDIQLGWQFGPIEASVGLERHLSQSPFHAQSMRAKLAWGLFNQGTRLGMEFSRASQKRPVTYFVDRDLRVKPRPIAVSSEKTALSLEQVISSRWQGALKVSTRGSNSERPSAWGVESRHSVALSGAWFAKAGISYWSERQTENLKNERGYFEAKSGFAELLFEPSYGWLLAAGYGLTIEREEDPSASRLIQVGSDRYSFQVVRTSGRSRYRLTGAFSRRNDQGSSMEMGGGVTWEI